MKIIGIVAGAVIIAVVVAVVGWKLIANRSTEATIKLTAEIPGKVAVVYYSQSKVGNTATVAGWIAKHTSGKLIPIEPVEEYSDSYGDTLAEARNDMKNGGTRPIKDIPSLGEFDVVFIGSPIWYGSYAPPVAEFFKSRDFAGKLIVPFCTHGGGGAGRYFADIERACPKASIKEGLAIRGSNRVERRLGTGVSAHHTEDDIVGWLNAIFPKK